MSTAVLISGQARTFDVCFKSQRWAVYRKLHDPHFFVSIQDDAQAGMMDRLTDEYGADRVFIERVKQPELTDEQRRIFEEASKNGVAWGIAGKVDGIYKQLWNMARVWDFMVKICGDETGPVYPGSFKRFIRIRPDLYFHNFTPPEMPPGMRDVVTVPWWGSWGGIPDRFAVIDGYGPAFAYFTTFHRIADLITAGCPFHPETMLGYNLEREAVHVEQLLDAEFTTIRMPGDSRPHDKAVYSNRDVFRYVNARLAAGPCQE